LGSIENLLGLEAGSHDGIYQAAGAALAAAFSLSNPRS